MKSGSVSGTVRDGLNGTGTSTENKILKYIYRPHSYFFMIDPLCCTLGIYNKLIQLIVIPWRCYNYQLQVSMTSNDTVNDFQAQIIKAAMNSEELQWVISYINICQ